MDENQWCVYIHTNKENGKKYVGITSKPVDERWKNGFGYQKNTYFRNAIEKYTWNGFDHEIIESGLTEKEAKEKEVELIAKYKTNCYRYSNPTYGYNMTDGGEGICGYQHTEEWKIKHSQDMSGENNPHYGKSIKERLGDNGYEIWLKKQRELDRAGTNNPMYGVSPQERMDEDTFNQWREKVRISMTGVNNPNYGKSMSEEQKQKISKTKTGRKLTEDEKKRLIENKPVKTPVYCIELNTYFKSAAEAEREISVCARTILSYCSGDSGRKSAGKHPITGEKLHWRRATIEEYNNFIEGN